MMVYKCLHGLAPSYLADVCTPVSSVVGRWQLQSANSGTLVPGTRTNIGRRNFVMSGPATRNRLLVELRTSSLSVDTFAKKLKTHLFSCKHLRWLLCIRRDTNVHIDCLVHPRTEVGLTVVSSSAYDTERQIKVAIKKLARPFQSPVHAKRAYREIRMLKHMHHENVSHVFFNNSSHLVL